MNPPPALLSVRLSDVHPLHGGRALWVARRGGKFVQVVARGGAETRWHAPLEDGEWAEIERAVAASGLLSPEIASARPGVPDEVRAEIAIVPEAGAAVSAWKWAGDRHEGFDALARCLSARCRPEGEVIFSGSHDWAWRPEGFAEQS